MDSLGHDGSAGGVGVDAVGEAFGLVDERRVKIDDIGVRGLGDFAN